MPRSLTFALLLATGLVTLAASTAAQESFTIVVLPDPQNYSQFYPQIFNAQTQWIAQNHLARNIKFVIGVGDMVNHPDSAIEWQNADTAVHTLDAAGVPYAMAIGNHDYDGQLPSGRSAKAFNQHFGPARYAGRAWYGGQFPAGSNENFFATFTAGGRNYLVLVLEMHPRQTAVNWATNVIAAHPGTEVLMVTHSFMYIDDTRVDRCDTKDVSPANGYTPEDLWQDWARHQPQLSMIVSGHITSGTTGRRADLGDSGNLVNQMLSNYQTMPQGGGGYMRLMTFNPALNTIDVETYSPSSDTFLADAQNQFVLNMHATAATSGQGMVTGSLRSAVCEPLAGEVVRAGGASTSTDAMGHFAIPVPAPATYNVAVDAPNFNSGAMSRSVADSYASEADFFLSPVIPPGWSFVVSPAGIAGSTINSAETATYKVAVTPAAGFSGAVRLACSGLPANASCAISPGSMNVAGGPGIAVVSVATSVRATASVHSMPLSGGDPLSASFASLSLAFLFAQKRRSSSRLMACACATVVLAVMLMGTISCGGVGGASPPAAPQQGSTSPGAGTPSGSYSIVVTATSGAESHATSLTLTVR